MDSAKLNFRTLFTCGPVLKEPLTGNSGHPELRVPTSTPIFRWTRLPPLPGALVPVGGSEDLAQPGKNTSHKDSESGAKIGTQNGTLGNGTKNAFPWVNFDPLCQFPFASHKADSNQDKSARTSTTGLSNKLL